MCYSCHNIGNESHGVNMALKYQYILVDGSSYLFRAYHALPPLNNAAGLPTGAIYGVVSMIKRLTQDYAGAKIIVVFDPKGGSFRNELYSGYKADRGAMPDDLAVQIPYVHTIIQAMGFPLIVKEGYEADDVIASLVKIGKESSILISTLDKDLAQLVTDNVHLVNTMHNKYLDPQGVQDKFGVSPGQMRDLLALMGDKSDSVPGVPGVGPKTAAKWLQQYGDIEGIIAEQDALKGKVGESFRAHILDIELSRQLVSLVYDVPVADSLADIPTNAPDNIRLKDFFQELGFKKWLSELGKKEAISIDFTNIDSEDRLIEQLALARCLEVGLFVDKESAYIGISSKVLKVSLSDHLLPVFFSWLGPRVLVMYDVKSSWGVVSQYMPARIFDVMLAQYVIDSTSSNKLEDMLNSAVGDYHYQQMPEASFGALVAGSLVMIREYLLPKLVAVSGLSYLEEIELPLMTILARMESCGVQIDVALLDSYAQELDAAMKKLVAKAHDLAGEDFNLGSPKQLRGILFEKMGLESREKTPTGDLSTSESALQGLRDQHLIVNTILEYRGLSKLASTYAIPLVRDATDLGRIHGRFNQAVTVTGRLSSAGPNLQNIPVRTKEGRTIRSAFIAPEGYKVVSADYSQVELRILAHFSEDAALCQAFEAGKDIHVATAAGVHNIPLDQVTPEQRSNAKAVNFGLIYGMGAHGLSKQLGVDKEKAQTLIDAYFSAYPGVKQYLDSVRTQVQIDGWVSTVLGRRLQMPSARSGQGMEKQAALRAAVNAPMQGSASDLIKRAMLLIDQRLSEFDYKMTMQVHDELVFEVKEEQVLQFCKQVSACMEEAIPLKVPLVVDVYVGDSWDEAH